MCTGWRKKERNEEKEVRRDGEDRGRNEEGLSFPMTLSFILKSAD
jgi:hypothetical protein